jgi:hypothetical protein
VKLHLKQGWREAEMTRVAKYQVLTAASIKMDVFWTVAPRSTVEVHDTSVNFYHITRRINPEDNPHSLRAQFRRCLCTDKPLIISHKITIVEKQSSHVGCDGTPTKPTSGQTDFPTGVKYSTLIRK